MKIRYRLGFQSEQIPSTVIFIINTVLILEYYSQMLKEATYPITIRQQTFSRAFAK